jgi:hypothetical protein
VLQHAFEVEGIPSYLRALKASVPRILSTIDFFGCEVAETFRGRSVSDLRKLLLRANKLELSARVAYHRVVVSASSHSNAAPDSYSS